MIWARRVLPSAAALAALALPAGAAARPLRPFGHACVPANGVRLCPTASLAERVRSFDGVPLDVDVTLPAGGDGPFPTLVLAHGYGGDKHSFEATAPTTRGYDNLAFARRGFAVVTASARGWGDSCGTAASRAADPAGCARGYVRLDDQRYEARDVQRLLGILVDEGVARAGALAASGISYGGGLSLELAYLRDRIRRPDGRFAPWRSPRGRRLSLGAAWARWPWSDLVAALVPNGRFLSFDPRTYGRSRDPIGIPKLSYATALYLLGAARGYYAPRGLDAQADPTRWSAALAAPGPLGAAARAALDELAAHHQAYGLPGSPAPLLVQSGWTDDLFPAAEALRVYGALRARDPRAAIALQLGDLGHPRGTNAANLDRFFLAQGARFLTARLRGRGRGRPPAPGSVTAFTQRCPRGAPAGGPYRGPSLAALQRGRFAFGARRPQTVPAGGDLAGGPPFDPVPTLDRAGTVDACRTVPARRARGVATYTRRSYGFTLLGLPLVGATVRTRGGPGQLDPRLYDVAGGRQRLVSRGAYRLRAGQRGRVALELNGGGYTFPCGHTVKLELRGNDANYLRPDAAPFSVRVSDVRVALPARLAPRLALTLSPHRLVAGRSERVAARVTSGMGACRRAVGGALVTLAGRRRRTDAAGRAVLRVRPAHAGAYAARAARRGYAPGRAVVVAAAARFTG